MIRFVPLSRCSIPRFQEFLSDTTIDDPLEATIGYRESPDGINAVNQWVKQNAKSDANIMGVDVLSFDVI